MPDHFSLQIGDSHYTEENILQGKFEPTITDSFTQALLRFCQSWLKGQDSFTIHTSGSTGQPKPISLSRQQMQASARQTVKALGLSAGNSALLCINAEYIGGKMMLVRAMEHGLHLTATPPSADPLAHLPTDTHFDFSALVPLQLEAILRNPHSKAILQNMKAVIIGGAAVSSSLREQLRNIKAPLFSTYGMTETVSHIALQRLNGPEATDFFTAFPEVKLSQDSRGCLVIEGAVTGNIPVVTNDVVDLSGGNRFRWIGRADNIINSGGIKIQLEKIDALAAAAFLQLGIERKVFAWALPEEQLGQRLVLIAEGAPFTTATETEVFSHLKLVLGKYELPKAIFFVKNFCFTPSGKIQKGATAALIDKP
ncbi:AMP-binding protein [Nafulsella turpanensis]|uniref:AMP-binding protein n=1 Tax=Nafulsella turpanensis TaxID=1265690 RepID=UPI0003458602|nr:AMP-binding protein [Nafulsella turpanensis]